MSPNSHVVKWLISSYRCVLQKMRVKEAQESSPACILAAARMGNLEALETRTMLSTVQITDLTKASYVGTPTLQAGMQDVLAEGIRGVANSLNTISQSGGFATDVPGVLQYTSFGTAPKAANLLQMLGSVNGSGLSSLIKNHAASPIDALLDGSA